MKEQSFYEFADFINIISGERPEHLRLGQYAFNVLWEEHPEIAARIRGTASDPFYEDGRMPQFISAVLMLWCDKRRVEVKVNSLDEAVDKVVLCTDGEKRILRGLSKNLGRYDCQTWSKKGWTCFGETWIRDCRELFIGGTIIEDAPEP